MWTQVAWRIVLKGTTQTQANNYAHKCVRQLRITTLLRPITPVLRNVQMGCMRIQAREDVLNGVPK